MSQANSKTTMTTTRRDIAAGGLVTLLLASTAAGSAKAEELDEALIAAVTELRQRDAEHQGLKPIMGGPDAAEADRAWSYCDETLWPRQNELIETITGTPARSPEGLRAKALALELWLNREVPVFVGETFEDRAEAPDLLAMSLARDVMGRAI